MKKSNRNFKTSITVLAALGIICSNQQDGTVNALE
jgi:hypothetical protein